MPYVISAHLDTNNVHLFGFAYYTAGCGNFGINHACANAEEATTTFEMGT